MVKPLRLLLMSAAVCALAACATAPSPPAGPVASRIAAASAAPDGDSASVYGLYLAGQAALDAGDTAGAAAYFARAGAADPSAGFIKERVFTAALLAGDVPKAAEEAPGPGEGSDSSQALGALTQAVEYLAQGRNREAYDKLNQPQPGFPNAAPVELLKPWAAAALGKTAESLTQPSTGDRLLKLMAALDQAILFERAHRYDEAETAYKALLSEKIGEGIVAPAYGVFLERRGRRAEAITLYDQSLADEPGDSSLLAARARAVAKREPPAVPTIREGAAQALMAPAAAVLADKQTEMGLVYLRLILRLDPAREDAWMMAGDVMASGGDLVSARAAYSQVGPKSLRYVEARSRLALSYLPDDKADALRIARETAAASPDSDAAQLNLADILRDGEHYEESAKVLDGLIAKAGDHADWHLYYGRGVALERSGHWPEAQRDLDKALALKPDQPEVLNYLGYSWVNRGVKVKDGLTLIEKAVLAEPNEGAYVDSLGWAYYRLGDYAKAVQYLESASALDAGDAEINDHLGDAYWRAGRRDEARFQWRAVLSMDPDPDVKARAQAKLASPVGPDTSVPAAPAAAAAAAPSTTPVARP